MTVLLSSCTIWNLLAHLAALGVGDTVVNGCVELPDGLHDVPDQLGRLP